MKNYKIEIKIYGSITVTIYKKEKSAHLAYLQAVEELKEVNKDSLLDDAVNIEIRAIESVEEI